LKIGRSRGSAPAILLLLLAAAAWLYLTPPRGVAAEPAAPRTPIPFPIPMHRSKWLPEEQSRYDKESPDRRFIFVSQNLQMMYVFVDGEIIKAIPCSTGLPEPGKRTPSWTGRIGEYVGTFFSFGTYADEGWFLFWDAGGILIHGAPYLNEDNKKVYQELDALGKYPASHGCIRIPPAEAEWLTQWSPEGTLIMIAPLTVTHARE